MSPIPRIARVPLTSKQPDACPHCGGRNLTRRGTRKKKLEIVQLWRCGSCKRVLTRRVPGLRLFDIKCAWFNEEEYCEIFPRTLFLSH